MYTLLVGIHVINVYADKEGLIGWWVFYTISATNYPLTPSFLSQMATSQSDILITLKFPLEISWNSIFDMIEYTDLNNL